MNIKVSSDFSTFFFSKIYLEAKKSCLNEGYFNQKVFSCLFVSQILFHANKKLKIKTQKKKNEKLNYKIIN